MVVMEIARKGTGPREFRVVDCEDPCEAIRVVSEAGFPFEDYRVTAFNPRDGVVRVTVEKRVVAEESCLPSEDKPSVALLNALAPLLDLPLDCTGITLVCDVHDVPHLEVRRVLGNHHRVTT